MGVFLSGFVCRGPIDMIASSFLVPGCHHHFPPTYYSLICMCPPFVAWGSLVRERTHTYFLDFSRGLTCNSSLYDCSTHINLVNLVRYNVWFRSTLRGVERGSKYGNMLNGTSPRLGVLNVIRTNCVWVTYKSNILQGV